MRIPEDEKRVIDTWIVSNGLDEVGNPRGTMYTGGTPLFDESTGRRVDRYEYIVGAHPDRPWATLETLEAEPPSPDAEPPSSGEGVSLVHVLYIIIYKSGLAPARNASSYSSFVFSRVRRRALRL